MTIPVTPKIARKDFGDQHDISKIEEPLQSMASPDPDAEQEKRKHQQEKKEEKYTLHDDDTDGGYFGLGGAGSTIASNPKEELMDGPQPNTEQEPDPESDSTQLQESLQAKYEPARGDEFTKAWGPVRAAISSSPETEEQFSKPSVHSLASPRSDRGVRDTEKQEKEKRRWSLPFGKKTPTEDKKPLQKEVKTPVKEDIEKDGGYPGLGGTESTNPSQQHPEDPNPDCVRKESTQGTLYDWVK